MNIDIRAAGQAASDLDARADFCRELALSAGGVALDGFERQAPTGFRMKGPQDFLTETDAAVERHVRARHRRGLPAATASSARRPAAAPAATPGWSTRSTAPPTSPAASRTSASRSPSSATARSRSARSATPRSASCYFARRGAGRDAQRRADPGRPDPRLRLRLRRARLVDPRAERALPRGDGRAARPRRQRAARRLRRAGARLGRRRPLGRLCRGAHERLGLPRRACSSSTEAGGRVGPFLDLGGLADGGPVIAAAPGIAAGLRRGDRPRARGMNAAPAARPGDDQPDRAGRPALRGRPLRRRHGGRRRSRPARRRTASPRSSTAP